MAQFVVRVSETRVVAFVLEAETYEEAEERAVTAAEYELEETDQDQELEIEIYTMDDDSSLILVPISGTGK